MLFRKVHHKAKSQICLSIVYAIAVIALFLPSRSFGAQVIQYGNAAQGPDNTTFIISLVNNDVGTVYQSATLDLEALLGGVADWISLHSSGANFAGKSHAQIFSQFYFALGGEVSTGWSAIPNGTILEITHINGIPGLQYTTWQASSYNGGIQDTMNLYCTLPNSALNGLNLSSSTNLVLNAFSALTFGGATAYTTAYSYNVLEHPTTNLTILRIATLPAGPMLDGEASPLTNMAVQISVKVSPTGTVYALQYVDSLSQTNWGVISSTNKATSNETDMVYDLAPSPSNRFYRLGVQ